MIRFINAHRHRFGVEPICRTLAVAPSSYYAARSRPPSARELGDAELKLDIGLRDIRLDPRRPERTESTAPVPD